MSTIIVIAFILVILIACIFLAWRDDKIGDLEKRVEFLEQKSNKKIVSRLFFVELKSINSVLDTLNNCFYDIDETAIMILIQNTGLKMCQMNGGNPYLSATWKL